MFESQRAYAIMAIGAVAGFIWIIGGNAVIGALIGAFLPSSLVFPLRVLIELAGSYLILCAIVATLFVAHGGLRWLFRRNR